MMEETLYELTQEYRVLKEMMEDPDAEAESLQDSLDSIDGIYEVKIENCWKVIKELDIKAKALKDEETRLSNRRKSIENHMEWLKKNIETSMIATGKTKFKTDLFSFGIQKNPASLKLAEDIDYNEVPSEFLIFPEPKVDKDKVKESIKAGAEYEWAAMVQTEGLRVR